MDNRVANKPVQEQTRSSGCGKSRCSPAAADVCLMRRREFLELDEATSLDLRYAGWSARLPMPYPPAAAFV
jgi:hypothetical protein